MSFKFEGKELATRKLNIQTKPVDRLIMANVFRDHARRHTVIFVFDKLRERGE